MKVNEMRGLLATRGLGRVVDGLMALAAPTVRIYIERADEVEIPVGSSKLGGRPDLPAGVEWPAWHEHMAFIGQINLAEAAPYDREGALPDHGLLSVFWETDGEPLYAERWGMPEDTPYHEAQYHKPISRSWRVLYHVEDPSTFVRRTVPDDVNDMVRYQACTARFAAEVTLPDADGPEVAPLGLTTEERVALIAIQDPVNHGKWEEGGHHLLGYPYNLSGPTLVTCDHEERGVPWDVWTRASPQGRIEIQRAATQRWRLLLQVSSSDDTLMDWGGGGVVHFCIERDALAARDFSRVWLTMQFL